MSKITTDIEQSKRLAKVLPIDSADMYWDYDVKKKEYYLMVMDEQFDDTCILAWSVSALMNILPNHIRTSERYECKYSIDIRKYGWGDNVTMYQIAYGNSLGISGSWHDMISSPENENLVDTCVDMLEWLIENNFLKIEKQHE